MKQTYIARRNENSESLPAVTDINDFAFFHSGCFKDITGKMKYQRDDNSNDMYVRISHGKKKIYLKYHAANISKDNVILSYSNLCRLGLIHEEDKTVEISESCSLCYSWYNGNSAAKWGYRISIISLIISIVSIVLALILHFCNQLS